jgi:ketosteroid isomerase-like protein
MTTRRLARSVSALLLALPLLGGAPAPAAAAGQTHDAAALPSPSVARASLAAYLSLWRADAAAGDASRFSEDVVMRFEHGNPVLRGEVRGRASVITHVRAVARPGTPWRIGDVRIFPTLRDDVYFAQFTAAASAADGGPAVEQTVVLMLELSGEKLVRLVEFANPASALAAHTPQRSP